jgi:hypothetical protein
VADTETEGYVNSHRIMLALLIKLNLAAEDEPTAGDVGQLFDARATMSQEGNGRGPGGGPNNDPGPD